MKGKEHTCSKSDSDEEKPGKDIELKETKVPFDMKSFWKNINEKYFKSVNEINVTDINHLIHYYSKYDFNNDNIFTKFGFPKTINCLVGKSLELAARKSNPSLYTKFFGMYIYVDKYDYLINNLNNEEIDEEIQAIEEKVNAISSNNIVYLKSINDKIINFKRDITVDPSDCTSLQYRLDNIINQIYILQMRQLAESISCIKKDAKNNLYFLLFDSSENIDSLSLDEKSYKYLLKYRDAMNSVSVYDLFQEKIHLYFNVNNNDQIDKKKGKKTRLNNNDDIQIARSVNINYEFCHHCKQRKPGEVMVKCMSNNCSKYCEKPIKSFYINNSCVVRKNKNFIITNFTGDPKDILDGYYTKKIANVCNRTFCHFCLKGSYDQIIENIKDRKDWICPWCNGTCFCSRCIRYDQILKLITLYVSLDGELKDVYNILTAKCFILGKLGESMLVSNIIVIHNDINNKSNNRLIKNKSDFNNIENMLDTIIKYRHDLVNLKEYYNLEFIKAYQERALFNEEKQLIESGSLSLDLVIPQDDNVYIRKKYKRPSTQEYKKSIINDFSKKHKFIRLKKQFNKLN